MSLQYIREVVVASADVAASAAFHQEAFDLEVLAGSPESGDVLLGVAGCAGGQLRLVPATSSVDEAPAVWDLGARLLGIYSHDLDAHGGRDGPRRRRAPHAGDLPVRHRLAVRAGRTRRRRRLVDRAAGRPRCATGPVRPMRPRRSVSTPSCTPRSWSSTTTTPRSPSSRPPVSRRPSTARCRAPPFDELVGMPADAALRLAFMVGSDQASARLEIMSFTGVPAADRSRRPGRHPAPGLRGRRPAGRRRGDAGRRRRRRSVLTSCADPSASRSRSSPRELRARGDRRRRCRRWRPRHHDRCRRSWRRRAPGREAAAARRDAAHRQRRVLRRRQPASAAARHRGLPGTPLRRGHDAVARPGRQGPRLALGEQPGPARSTGSTTTASSSTTTAPA